MTVALFISSIMGDSKCIIENSLARLYPRPQFRQWPACSIILAYRPKTNFLTNNRGTFCWIHPGPTDVEGSGLDCELNVFDCSTVVSIEALAVSEIIPIHSFTTPYIMYTHQYTNSFLSLKQETYAMHAIYTTFSVSLCSSFSTLHQEWEFSFTSVQHNDKHSTVHSAPYS